MNEVSKAIHLAAPVQRVWEFLQQGRVEPTFQHQPI